MRREDIQGGEQIAETHHEQCSGEQYAHADRQFLEMPVQAMDRLIIHIGYSSGPVRSHRVAPLLP
jgi:hypothetical protein